MITGNSISPSCSVSDTQQNVLHSRTNSTTLVGRLEYDSTFGIIRAVYTMGSCYIYYKHRTRGIQHVWPSDENVGL